MANDIGGMDAGNQTADHVGENHAEETRKKKLFIGEFESPKLVDIIINKQTQYYTLWAVYTVVQFALANFGLNRQLHPAVVIAALVGVWAFNLGHLSFVLKCVEQINKSRIALSYALIEDNEKYETALRNSFEDMGQGDFFWKFYKIKNDRSSYIINSIVHFIIDICASVAFVINQIQIQAKIT